MTSTEGSAVTIDTPDGAMRAWAAGPPDAATAVIVIPEAFGLNGYIEGVAEALGAAGHRGLALDVFHRAGGGTAPYDDFSKVLPLFEGLTDEGFLTDIDAAVALLGTQGIPPERIGLVGFCMGGRVTFLTAVRRSLGAAVGFYGGGIVTARLPQFPPLVGEASGLRTPWLGLFGDLDESIPAADVETIRAALTSDAPAATEWDIVRYPEAGHGFHCDQRPTHHNAAAAADGWSRALAWFQRHLAGT